MKSGPAFAAATRRPRRRRAPIKPIERVVFPLSLAAAARTKRGIEEGIFPLTFARPLWLLAALLVMALLGAAYRIAEGRRMHRALLYSDLKFMLEAAAPSPVPGLLLFGFWFLGLALLAASIGEPRLSVRVPARDGTVIICIDTSGSMRAHDLDPSRAAAAKLAARSFIDAVPEGVRVGIVSFATSALLIAGPTSDLVAAQDALERVPAPNGATAIGDALGLADQTMPAHGRRAVILLTDGVNNRGSDPIAAAQALGRRGIAVYTVGIGKSASGELIPGTGELADLDEDALRAIADNANGAYASARDASSLRGVFENLARSTVWESRQVDISLGAALASAMILALTLFGGLAAGRFP
jgi:Ca-activated chloride channel family protein